MIRLVPGALILAGLGLQPAHAQLDGLIDRLVRPVPPSYPYYYRPPPAYPPPYYPPAYPPASRPYYPPAYAPAAPRPAVSVMEAQRMLGALGYDAGAVDGVAGPRVTDAVRAFQRDHGQAADGRLSGETMAALRAALHERESAPSTAAAPDAAPIPAAASAALPTEGKYCLFGPGKSSDMLLVRDSGGSLSFGLSSWLPNGHNFAVSGAAEPDGDRWRYAAGMRSNDPTEHCRITIARLPDGGFRFATDPVARCESSGGYGAAPREPFLFPAGSRMGNPPQSLDVEMLMRVDCDKPRAGFRPEPSPGLLFAAEATAGPERHDARVRFSCRRDGKLVRADLSLDLDVRDPDELQRTIDLNAMEGPYPQSPAQVTVKVTHPDGNDPLEIGFGANGSSIPGDAFEIGLYEQGSTKGPKLLSTVVGAVAERAGQLTLRLKNPAADKPALEAILSVSQADAAALRQSMRACLAVQ